MVLFFYFLDVDGKVVHLVQRAPPSTRTTTSTRSSSVDNNPSNMRNAPLFRTIDGMVLGAMAIPVNPNNGVGFLTSVFID